MRFWSGPVLALSMLATPAMALELQAAPGASGSINITTDSAPGWLPTAAQRQAALAATTGFLSALEQGRFAEAYAMLAEAVRRDLPFAQFAAAEQKFNDTAGATQSWRALKLTWTKDPAGAPAGIYVAIDLAERFANIDRDCGYVVLYQPKAGTPFLLMRRENNFIDNASARHIVQTRSAAELDRTWRAMSRFCPDQ